MAEYHVIGVMSGTSTDGMDLAYCHFTEENEQWKWMIKRALTIPYNKEWRSTLIDLLRKGENEIDRVDEEYGKYLSGLIVDFIDQYHLKPELIASHGHTVFHQPEKGITRQIGDGQIIANETGLAVVCDFRSRDVSLGGQGAPLVPVGDKMLFGEYDYCLNLGGFANISYDDEQGLRRAFDICPVNMVLNALALEEGKLFDDKGEMAASGQVDEELLEQLNRLEYYSSPAPKSLGREWVEAMFNPALCSSAASTKDKLRTATEHCALQISNCMHPGKALVTGGGTCNDFLMSRIKELCPAEVVIPDKQLIDYKEALIFAFLGVLRTLNKVNCMASVTGARQDCSGGEIMRPA